MNGCRNSQNYEEGLFSLTNDEFVKDDEGARIMGVSTPIPRVRVLRAFQTLAVAAASQSPSHQPLNDHTTVFTAAKNMTDGAQSTSQSGASLFSK